MRLRCSVTLGVSFEGALVSLRWAVFCGSWGVGPERGPEIGAPPRWEVSSFSAGQTTTFYRRGARARGVCSQAREVVGRNNS